MGARSLEARLTLRILASVAVVLATISATAVVVTGRLLDDGDSQSARTAARASLDAVSRELAEGDSLTLAEDEAAAEARATGLRVLFVDGLAHDQSAAAELARVAPGTCDDVTDDQGQPWRACADRSGDRTAVAAISIAANRAAVRSLAHGMLLALLLAFVAVWFAVRRSLSKPIGELGALVEWAEAVVEDERPQRLKASTTSEIDKLQASFDVLVRRLFRALERERASSAHIAHEFRTPLTSIRAELDALARAEGAAARVQADRMRADVDRLTEVIDAVLLLSSTEKQFDGPLVNVADVLRDVAPHGARVSAPDEALVRGDERLLALALKNIIRNAQTYGKGPAELFVRRRGDQVEIGVTDCGEGVPDSVREKMFDRYWRGEADGRGSGLGLALVRAVAERHGGDASAQSVDAGGLSVLFTVPLVMWSDR